MIFLCGLSKTLEGVTDAQRLLIYAAQPTHACRLRPDAVSPTRPAYPYSSPETSARYSKNLSVVPSSRTVAAKA